MADILPHLTVPGPGLVSAGASAREGLCPRAGFRQGDEQVLSDTFHPSYTTSARPYRSTEGLCYCLRPISSESLFPRGSLRPCFAAAEGALCRKLLFNRETKKKLQGLDQLLA